MDYLELFQTKLQKLRRAGSNGQYVALCPYHEDRQPSFSVNVDTGLWNCKSCGVKGNAYQFAKDMDMDKPHQYIKETNGYIKPYEPIQHDLDCETLLVKYLDNLDTYSHTLPESEINLEVLSDLGIGFDDNGILVFSYWKDGKVVGFKHHKVKTAGYAKNHWYHSMQIPRFRHDKPLIICEGEKDIIPLIQWGHQAITNTGGAKSIPKIDTDYDLKVFQEFESLHICYDNDDAGREGSDNLSKVLRDAYPTKPIKVYQWANDLPDKWDIWDSFTKNKAECFYDAQKNARSVEINNRIGGFEVFTEDDFDEMELIDEPMIVDNFLPSDSLVVIAGESGANKSFFAMQMAMSIANGDDSFLSFKINQKELKICYVDTELGNKKLNKRYRSIKQEFSNWNDKKNITWLSKKGIGEAPYDDIDKFIEGKGFDLLIIDCLYNTTNNADISKGHNVSRYTDKITILKQKHNLISVLCVHHFNKGGKQEGLILDRMTGASNLQNWLEHSVLICKTNIIGKRLIKTDKMRDDAENNCHYLLNFEYPLLKNEGIVEEWKHLVVEDSDMIKWSSLLETLNDQFTTQDFYRSVNRYSKIEISDRSKRQWLKNMDNANVINHLKQGYWEKNLKIIKKEG